MSELNLNAAQQAQVQRALEEQLVKYVRQIELRKWAMQQAIEITKIEITKNRAVDDVQKLAQAIYNFVRKEE
jgi:hypothetical protein